MNSCLFPILIAVFGSFLWFGTASTEISTAPEPAVVEGVIVSTPATANAEAYILAAAAGDIETASQYACEVNADEMLAGIGDRPAMTIDGLVCSDEGDNTVRCTFNSDLGVLEDLTNVEMIFTVDENGMVCELITSSTGADNIPSE